MLPLGEPEVNPLFFESIDVFDLAADFFENLAPITTVVVNLAREAAQTQLAEAAVNHIQSGTLLRTNQNFLAACERVRDQVQDNL